MGAVVQTERSGGRVEVERLADDWVQIKLFDAHGELEAITELRPTYHARYAEALLTVQSEIAADEASSVPARSRVLRFPAIAQALLLLLLVVAA